MYDDLLGPLDEERPKLARGKVGKVLNRKPIDLSKDAKPANSKDPNKIVEVCPSCGGDVDECDCDEIDYDTSPDEEEDEPYEEECEDCAQCDGCDSGDQGSGSDPWSP